MLKVDKIELLDTIESINEKISLIAKQKELVDSLQKSFYRIENYSSDLGREYRTFNENLTKVLHDYKDLNMHVKDDTISSYDYIAEYAKDTVNQANEELNRIINSMKE